ncbi:hypothetical protein MINTM026_16210 [Mycobacterium intracellulare]|nr:hypothetical protein MINTM026_16210 [Mycobacterium intracellulare]
MTCANARADILGRPFLPVGASPALAMVNNRFGDLFRRARIVSLLQMGFFQANVPAANPDAVIDADRIRGCRPSCAAGNNAGWMSATAVPPAGRRGERFAARAVDDLGVQADRPDGQVRRNGIVGSETRWGG